MAASSQDRTESTSERAPSPTAGMSLPPGPRGRRFRNLRERVVDFRGFMGRLHEEYGDIVFYRIPGMNCCAVFDVDLITDFMTTRHDSFPAFQDKASYGVMKNPGVFRVDGEQHRLLHDVIEQAFRPEHMPFHIEIMIEQALGMPARWRSGETIDGRDEMAHFVSGSLLQSIFGRDANVTAGHAQQALWAVKWDWALSFMPIRTSWLRALPLARNRRFREAIAAFDRVIYDTIRTARAGAGSGHDVISCFVRSAGRDDMKALRLFDDDSKIRDEIYSIVLGNSDPPLNALVHMVHYLSHNPNVQERLEQEVDDVLSGRPIEAADLPRLPYARAVFQETIRLSPPAFGGNGQLKTVRNDTTLGGYCLPGGTMIHPCAGIPHRKLDYWERPSDFYPERWVAEAGPTRAGCPAHAYMPFGLDPRACPGSEYATNLAIIAATTFAQHVRFLPASDELPKPEPLGIGVKGPYPVTVKERPGRA